MNCPPNVTVYGLTVEEVGNLIEDHARLGKKYDQMREAFQTLSVKHFTMVKDYEKEKQTRSSILARDFGEMTKNLQEANKKIEQLEETVKLQSDAIAAKERVIGAYTRTYAGLRNDIYQALGKEREI